MSVTYDWACDVIGISCYEVSCYVLEVVKLVRLSIMGTKQNMKSNLPVKARSAAH